MRAGLRLGLAMLATVLALGQVPALAQSTSPATTNTPAPETIGPSELQNFSLPGTVSRPSQQPAETAPPPQQQAPPARRPAPRPGRTATAPPPETKAAPARVVQPRPQPAPVIEPPLAQPQRRAPVTSATASTQTIALPPPAPALATPGFAPPPEEPAVPAPSGGGPSMVLWLMLAAALGGGAALLLWRRRSRAALAGGAGFDLFSAPEPAPEPVSARPAPRLDPAPAPRPDPVPPPRAAPPRPVGIVASSLRPWIDLGFAPLACDIEPDRLVLHFDLEMFNSGSAMARELLVEASLFNPGPTQQQDIAAFFATPAGPGERIPEVGPLKRLTIRNSIVAERANIQTVEVAGKQVYVPVIAFNVHYGGGGGAQTSASYVVGRDTGGDKLGPLVLGSRPRQVTGLAVRPLPIAVRK